MSGDRAFDNDDIVESVLFLGKLLLKDKTIVITKTITAEYKDSPQNLGLSLGTLSKNKEGTFLVFNKESISWLKVEARENVKIAKKASVQQS